MCLAACQAFRLPTLVYGAPDLRLGAVETHLRLLDFKHPYHNVSNVIKGVCEEESAGMLRHFSRDEGEKTDLSGKRFWPFPWRRDVH
jgi:tRNA(adenine34) deaminase